MYLFRLCLYQKISIIIQNNRGEDIEGHSKPLPTCPILCECLCNLLLDHLNTLFGLVKKSSNEPIAARLSIVQISLRLRHLTVVPYIII